MIQFNTTGSILTPVFEDINYILQYENKSLFEILTNNKFSVTSYSFKGSSPIWQLYKESTALAQLSPDVNNSRLQESSKVLLDFSNLGFKTFYHRDGIYGVNTYLANINKYKGYTSILSVIEDKITREEFNKLISVDSSLSPRSIKFIGNTSIYTSQYHREYTPSNNDKRYNNNINLILKKLKNKLILKADKINDVKYYSTEKGQYVPITTFVDEVSVVQPFKHILSGRQKSFTLSKASTRINKISRVYIRIKYNNSVTVSNNIVNINNAYNPDLYATTNPILLRMGDTINYKGFRISLREDNINLIGNIEAMPEHLPDLIISNKDIHMDNFDYYISEVIVL